MASNSEVSNSSAPDFGAAMPTSAPRDAGSGQWRGCASVDHYPGIRAPRDGSCSCIDEATSHGADGRINAALRTSRGADGWINATLGTSCSADGRGRGRGRSRLRRLRGCSRSGNLAGARQRRPAPGARRPGGVGRGVARVARGLVPPWGRGVAPRDRGGEHREW